MRLGVREADLVARLGDALGARRFGDGGGDRRCDVAVMATGRSDYPNQINNVLAFPGVFKGALDVRARTINEAMKLAAAQAIAGVIPEDELHPDYIIPSVFNRKVAESVAEAVAEAAVASGVARRKQRAQDQVGVSP